MRPGDVIVQGNKYSHVVTASDPSAELWTVTIERSFVLNADGTKSPPPPAMPEQRSLLVEPGFLFRRIVGPGDDATSA